MKIRVTGLDTCYKVAKEINANRVLSILDPDKEIHRFLPPVEEHKIIRFQDWSKPEMPGAPQKRHVEDILKWGELTDETDTILVHCHAGISRSTAAALMLMIQRGMSIKEAVEYLKEIRPQAIPNPIMTKFADEILGCDGELFIRAEKLATSVMERVYGFDNQHRERFHQLLVDWRSQPEPEKYED